MRFTPRIQRLLAAITCLTIAGGCPSSDPTSPKAGVPEVIEGAGEKTAEESGDNTDSVKALEAAGAILTKDTAGHVVKVELNHDRGKDDDLSHLIGLPSVRSVAAEATGVTDAGLIHLKGHPNVRELKLERSSVTNAGMAHLKEIPKLEDLDLKRVPIQAEGYAHIANIPTLKRLRVVYNGQHFTDDCLRAIAGMKQLELLDTQDCNLVTDKGLAVLQGFPKLKSLRLYGPNINDAVLAHLANATELRTLSLEQGSGVSADGLAHLKGLTRLKELSMYGATGITDAGMAHLSELINLEKLDVRQTRLSSLGLSYLKDLQNLKSLDLSETAAVGNEGLEHIQGLTNLEELNLLSTQIDDAGMPHLAGLKKLKSLNLEKCYITDEGLQHVAGLENLEYLHIGSTKITDAGLEHLKGLKNLKTLVVTYVEGVSGDGVGKLQESLPGLADVQR